MPDRYVRAGIIASSRVNKLSWPAEVFYRRLMSIVDDYGRYESMADLLRSQLYPLKVDRVSVSDIVKWLAECAAAGLVRLYTSSNKDYLEIIDFQQRLRSKSKFPNPPADIGEQLTAIDSNCQQHADACRPNTNTNTNANANNEYDNSDDGFDSFWDLYEKKVDTKKCKEKWTRMSIKDRELAMDALPKYISRTQEVKYRKNPLTWLNGQCWNDEKTSNANSHIKSTYSLDDISPVRMNR